MRVHAERTPDVAMWCDECHAKHRPSERHPLMPLNWQHADFCAKSFDRTRCYCWPPAPTPAEGER